MEASAPVVALDRPAAIPLRAARIVAIALLAALPYLNGLSGDFVFDDVGVIRDNPVIQRDPAWRVFTTVYEPGALYRPLTMLSYVANARVDGGPMGFHAVNVLLHVAVALAFYALALQLLAAPTAAWIAAALFAVHPIHTEAVTGIVGRAELLAALFSIAALLALARALRPGMINRPLAPSSERSERIEGPLAPSGEPSERLEGWLACSLTAFAVAVLCKESAFTTIGLVLVVHWRLAPADPIRRCASRSSPRMSSSAPPTSPCACGWWAPSGCRRRRARSTTRWRTSTPSPACARRWSCCGNTSPCSSCRRGCRRTSSFNQIPLQLSWGEPRVWVAGVLLTGLAAAAVAMWRRRPENTWGGALQPPETGGRKATSSPSSPAWSCGRTAR